MSQNFDFFFRSFLSQKCKNEEKNKKKKRKEIHRLFGRRNSYIKKIEESGKIILM